MPANLRRPLVLGLLAALCVVGFLLDSFCRGLAARGAYSSRSEMAVILFGATAFSSPYLLALWTALGAGSLVIRLFQASCLFGLVSFSHSALQNRANSISGAPGIWSPLLGLLLAGTLAFWLAGWLRGWRLTVIDERGALVPNHERRRFTIRALLLSMVLAGVVSGAARAVGWSAAEVWQTLLRRDTFATGLLGCGIAILFIPLAAAILAPRLRLLRLLWLPAAAGGIICLFLGIPLLFSLPGPRWEWEILLIGASISSAYCLGLLLIRLAGYRLVRHGATATPPSVGVVDAPSLAANP